MSPRLSRLRDAGWTCGRLSADGLSAAAAEAKAKLLSRCAQRLVQAGITDEQPVAAYYVPGRIEVLGKHTDYGGGRSLLAAAERGFCLVVRARPRGDRAVNLFDVARGEEVSFALDPELTPRLGHWSNYPMTVARRLARNFRAAASGADIAFASDLPPASGMSSSSAMIVALSLALIDINGLRDDPDFRRHIDGPESLAGYLGTIENGQTFGTLAGDRGVGTFGGSEDHTAILCCQPGKLSQYRFCPVVFERAIAVPDDCVFAIGVSGVVAEKTGEALEKYNRASRLARAVLERWRTASGRSDATLAAAVTHDAQAGQRIREALRGAGAGEFTPHQLLDRFEQFLVESETIIPQAGDVLAAGDLARFGDCVARSQDGAERLLGNQVPQTIDLCRQARDAGALAASSFGAGFGGSVWALVRRAGAQEFLTQWRSAYAARYPDLASRADFFATGAGPHAVTLTDT